MVLDIIYTFVLATLGFAVFTYISTKESGTNALMKYVSGGILFIILFGTLGVSLIGCSSFELPTLGMESRIRVLG